MFYTVDVEGHALYYNFALAPGVIVAVLVVSMAAGCFIGIIPGLRSTHGDTAEELKRQSQAVSADPRSSRWLAGAQAGIAVALAAIAGLLISSGHLMMTGENFETSHVALMRLRPRLVNYAPEKAQRYLRTVMEHLNALPGVESASMIGNGAVLFGGNAQVSMPGSADAQAITSRYIEAGPRYFETLRTPVLRGREFEAHDTLHSAPVAVVSETLARQLWPDGGVVGSTVIVNHQSRLVIGVVADVPLQTRGEPQYPYVYVPFWQNPTQSDARLCIRVKGDPATMIPLLIHEANRVDPDVPIAEAMPLSVQMAGIISDVRITATFAAYAAALALILSGLGVYGALAFSVSRRTKEIGIRLAVGAESAGVLTMLMREGMTVVLFGVAAGVVLAIGSTGLIRHLLFGSSGDDFLVYGTAALLVVGIGVVACLVPARRAASVDPVIALREE